MSKYINEILNDFTRIFCSLKFIYKYLLILAVALICYLPLMHGYVLTHDEQWTLLMVKKPLGEMMRIIATDDGNPPLYYLYQRLWYILETDPYNVFWVRFANFFVLFLTTLLGIFPVRRIYGDKIALLFTFLIFFMPSSFYLVTDIRGYALSGMLVAGVFVYAVSIATKANKGDFVWLSLFTVLSIYNHYYCGLWDILIWLCMFVILLKQKRYKDIGKMFLCGFVACLAYVPWLIVFIKQYMSMKSAWYPKFADVESAGWAFLLCFSKKRIFYVMLSCFLWTLIFELMTEKKNKISEKRTVLVFLIVCLLFYCLSLLVSIFMRPVLVGRYVYIFAPMFYLCSAIALVRLGNYLKLLPFVILPAVIYSYQTNYDEMQNKAWINLREYALKNIPPNSLIIVNNTYEHISTRFYLPEYAYVYAPINKTLVLLQDEVKEKQKSLKNLSEYDSIYYYKTFLNDSGENNMACQYVVTPPRQMSGCLLEVTPAQAEYIIKMGNFVLEESYH